MNIDYLVYWIDDDQDWFDSKDTQFDDLSDHIRTHGFNPNIQRIADPRKIPETKCDLLIVDFNLDEKIDGSDLISRLQKDYTVETVFYSNTDRQELASAAAKRELEGVFYSARSHVFTKTKQVFEISIRKILDTGNMRGIVMHGVSRLEKQLINILASKHQALTPDEKARFAASVRRKLASRIKDLEKHQKRMSDDASWSSISNTVGGLILDTSKRRELVAALISEHAYLEEFAGPIESLKELLAWRNALAHQEEILKDGRSHFLIGDNQELWDSTVGLRLRQEILRLNQAFIQCCEVISKKLSGHGK